mgnify:CR=1 FL=1
MIRHPFVGFLFPEHVFVEHILKVGYFCSLDFRISGWKNNPLVAERAYCVSASGYLVDGSLIPQIMETWGWMAALIRSKTNISQSEQIYNQRAYLPRIGTCFCRATRRQVLCIV